jgi:hypothetical protein
MLRQWIVCWLVAVADLQCQVRVGHKRENFNTNCYIDYYSVATVLNGLFSKISGWTVAHTAHPLDPPLVSGHHFFTVDVL